MEEGGTTRGRRFSPREDDDDESIGIVLAAGSRSPFEDQSCCADAAYIH